MRLRPGVVVLPRRFQLLRQNGDGLCTLLPDQKSRSRCAHTAYRPNELSHCTLPRPYAFGCSAWRLFKVRCAKWHCARKECVTRRSGAIPWSMRPFPYTASMDRVRLGRVLGRGARLVARTAWEALDAATATPPAGSPSRTTESHGTQAGTTAPPAPSRKQVVKAVRQPPVLEGQIAGGRSGQGKVQAPQVTSARPMHGLAPLRRASRAVSLEVTGSFFALFALSFGVGVWRERAQLHAGHAGLFRFTLFCAVTAFFAYFSIGNFIRARRLQ